MFLKITKNKEKKPLTKEQKKNIIILIIILILLLIRIVVFYFDIRNDTSEELGRKIEWQRNYFNTY